jgi:hypothetical protein
MIRIRPKGDEQIMANATHYVEDLRAIGQMLAGRNIVDFELKHVASGYFIQDLHEHTASFSSRIQNWFHGAPYSARAESLTVSPAEVTRLSAEGRARRTKAGQLTQFRELSNVLRTIGAYLDSKEVELLELQKRPISVTLQYRDKSGHDEIEDRPLTSFYKYFLELYDKRSQTEESRSAN